MKDTQYLDGFIGELLHINEVADNKLIDLNAGGGATFLLSHACVDLSAYAVKTAAERFGKTANTVLLNSALSGGEQRVTTGSNTFSWVSSDGKQDVKALHAFISGARKDLIARGNNPLFLSVGALKWRLCVKEHGKEILKDVTTPFLIYPVKLVVASGSAPVSIEFIADDVYVNPCLIAKLAQIYSEELANGLPAASASLSEPVDLQLLGDGTEYFKRVTEYIKNCNLGGEGTLFEFDKGVVAVSQYKHDELCTYYDIRRNKGKIYSHRLVEKIFENSSPDLSGGEAVLPEFVLQRDSVQEKIISDVVNGRSMIVKGPPGTGKTVTIANMLAALISRGKKVLFASKKISALTEVYAKLPDNLRKFAMLLDSETERAAAKLSPDEIKRDFKLLLADCKEYRASSTLDADIAQATAERARAMRSLSAYADLMFNDKRVAGDSFYSALAATCSDNLPVVEFADENAVMQVSREQYNVMLDNVGEAEKAFAVLSDNGSYKVYKSPWFGIDLSCDSDGAVTECARISDNVESIYTAVCEAVKDCGVSVDGMTLSEVAGAIKSTLEIGDVKKLAEIVDCAQAVSDIKSKLSDCEKCTANPLGLTEDISIEQLGERLAKLYSLPQYGLLTLKELKLICANARIFDNIGDEALGRLASVLKKIKSAENECQSLAAKCCEVFEESHFAGGAEILENGVKALSRYFENCPEKPKTFDFKAKKAYSALSALSFLKNPSFKDIAGATRYYSLMQEKKSEVEAGKEGLYKVLRGRIEDEQIECIYAVVEGCANAHLSLRAYVDGVCANEEFLSGCYALAERADGMTVGELAEGLNATYNLLLLVKELEKFNEYLTVYTDGDKGNEKRIAANLIGAAEFIAACRKQGASTENVVKAYTQLKPLGGIAESVDKAVNALTEFGVKYFKNYYAINGGDNNFADLKIMAGQSRNREALAAAARYSAIKHSKNNALDLSAFLYSFEKGEKLPEGATFKDVFAHSFYTLAVRAENAGLKLLRNGLGARAKNDFSRLEEVEKKLCALNAKLIEGKCISRIKPDDSDFIFIEDRNPNENMRLMFKRHADAILKLKRCLILSPYTASLLFDGEKYEDFDVLIVDEASQLEPALVLPVLFRSKQCVIVGDEWQMPPIKHFATLSPAQGDGGEGYSALESEISVLGLALRNGGFPVEELVCHYRSNTESLIRFSQKLFYPNMRTFPAPVPARLAAKGVAGLGIKDVYVENGVVCAGKNIAEADRVVEELKLHFDNYYDQKTCKLSMPVGVVAFGEAQCSLIESKVQADTALYKKIQSALEHFDDLPEKLIFFKTIETVQGQETGHLILSLTHGKRESGLYMHFGQLNQGKLGRCIFNVAVTRAQNMVTVIHSVRAAEITAENVSYIREYLETAARFSQGEGGQFVCGKAENGFIKSVADFILSKGIAPERVVINYGVTDGSVKIPIVILDESLTVAQLGIWCEKPVGGSYDFLDYNMRYRSSLKARGWALHEIFIHDWVDNNLNERQSLEKALAAINNRKEKN